MSSTDLTPEEIKELVQRVNIYLDTKGYLKVFRYNRVHDYLKQLRRKRLMK